MKATLLQKIKEGKIIVRKFPDNDYNEAITINGQTYYKHSRKSTSKDTPSKLNSDEIPKPVSGHISEPVPQQISQPGSDDVSKPVSEHISKETPEPDEKSISKSFLKELSSHSQSTFPFAPNKAFHKLITNFLTLFEKLFI